MQNKNSYIYIMTNKINGTLYIGVISNLLRRVWEHKNKVFEGFTKKYGLDKLVYYEVYDNIVNAIAREKQLKGGSRAKKLELINGFNKEWKDLYNELA